MTTPASAGPRRAALAFIFVTVLVDNLSFGLIIPVLPHLIANFLGGDIAAAAHWHTPSASVFMAMQFIFTSVQRTRVRQLIVYVIPRELMLAVDA